MIHCLGWAIALGILAVLGLATGCATETIVLNDHARTVQPGDTVPPLPEGEAVWWLMTPTGLGRMLPKGSK